MQAASSLQAALPALAPKDRAFAESLLQGFQRYGSWSAKQAYWAGELAKRASAPQVPAAPAAEYDLGPLMASFDKARQHLKQPGFRIALEGDNLRLKLAASTSRYAGQVMLTGDGAFEDRAYYGRIDAAGRYWPGRDAKGCEAEIQSALGRFTADPVAEAKAYAKLFGRCCFCARPLTDARSTAAGYGPDCANHWGLPWGA